jgi:hypothetical protein
MGAPSRSILETLMSIDYVALGRTCRAQAIKQSSIHFHSNGYSSVFISSNDGTGKLRLAHGNYLLCELELTWGPAGYGHFASQHVTLITDRPKPTESLVLDGFFAH